jgi:predicted KAP-like P-loop ATPase
VAHYLEYSRRQPGPLVLRFNPWWFGGSDDLTARFFDEVRTELSRRYRLQKAARVLANYAERLSEAPLRRPRAVDWFFRFMRFLAGREVEDLDTAKRRVEHVLKTQPRRIVVLVDDLDRLTAADLREVFRMVKAVANFPNVTYVLALSRKAAMHALASEVDDPAEYLEKIVQTPVELPVPDPLDLRRFFLEQLDRIISPLPDQRLFESSHWTSLYIKGVEPFLETPRDAVRLLNALRLTYPSVLGEVNIAASSLSKRCAYLLPWRTT